MFRPGKGFRGPGQSVAFKYGVGEAYKNLAAAKKKGLEWLNAQRVAQKLIPE